MQQQDALTRQVRPAADPETIRNALVAGEVAAVPDDAVTGTEEHVNAPAVRIRPDRVQTVLQWLRDEGDFDHCACVTAQEYASRFEVIYQLRRYDDPTAEFAVVVPAPSEAPAIDSAAAVYETTDWHEREAYDLLGVQFRDHPDLRRILLPETWQGHPLSSSYNQDQPQIVTYRESRDLREGAGGDGGVDPSAPETMLLNMGPHHPSTHGVLHLLVELDGETVANVEPDIGYIHRCEEQMCEQGTYRHQIMPYPDRWDWGGAGLLNEWAYARAAERLVDIEVPDYAQVLRTMCGELSRMLSHFLAFGTYCLDVIGDFNVVWQYAVRDRELIQDVLEDLTGQRLMFNYLRLGGVAWDVPTPREDFFEAIREFTDGLPPKVAEYHDLVTNNEILQARTIDTGVLEPAVAKQYGCTGPVARGSGVDYDLRRDDPYGYYDQLEWDVVTEDGCDNLARLLVRMQEVEQSARIVEQCVDLLEDWPADERTIQSNVPRTLKPERDSEIYSAVEAAKGELGIYIRSDGTDTPARFKIRGPSFSNLQALPAMTKGDYIADLVATMGSLDTIMGEVDR
jgi:NADH-quinone oxidoreductase subunit C/D